MSIANLLNTNSFDIKCNTLTNSEITTIDLASTNVLCENMSVTQSVAFTGDIEFATNKNPWVNLTGVNNQVFGLDGSNNMKLITIGSGNGIQGISTDTSDYLQISESNNVANINFIGTIPTQGITAINTNTPSDLQINTNNNITTIDFIANIPTQTTINTNTTNYLNVSENNNNYIIDFVGNIPTQGITQITTNTPSDLSISENNNIVNIDFVGSSGGSNVQGTANEIDVNGTNPQVLSLSNPIVLNNGALTIDKTEPSIIMIEQPTQDNKILLYPDSLTVQYLTGGNVSEYAKIQSSGMIVYDTVNQSSLTSTDLNVNNVNVNSLNVSSNNNIFTNLSGTQNQVLGLGENNTLQFFSIGSGGSGLQAITTGTSDYLQISESNNVANINFVGTIPSGGITNINNTDNNLVIAVNNSLATIDLNDTITLQSAGLSSTLSSNGYTFENTNPNNIITTLINENGIQLSTNTEQASVLITPTSILVDDSGQGHGVEMTSTTITAPNIICSGEFEMKNMYILPAVAPSPNQVMISQGGSNQLIWTNKATDGITSITSTDLTSSVTDSIATVNLNVQSGLSAGKYDNCNVTVNNKGIITEITAGTAGGITTIDSTDLQVNTSGQTSTINLLVQEGLSAGDYTNCNLSVNDKGIITHIQSGSNGGITSIDSTDLQVNTSGNTSTINLLLQENVSAGNYTNTNITVNDKGIITHIASGSDSGGITSISSSNNNISTNVVGSSATLELNNDLVLSTLTIGTSNQTNTLNTTSMIINDIASSGNCSIASNQIQMTNPNGTTIINPTNIQITDPTGTIQTNISSNNISTNNISTKSLSVVDNSSMVLYTMPSGAPSPGQVLAGVGGSQLMWESLPSSGIQTISSNNNNLNINNLGSLATITLNDTINNMTSITFTPDNVQTCEIKKDGVIVNNTTSNRSIVMDGTGFSVNDSDNILNTVITNSSITISNANDTTSLTTTSFRNKEISTPQLNMIDPTFGTLQYTLPNFGLAGKVLGMPLSGTTLEWLDQMSYANGTNININSSGGTISTINLNDIISLTDNGNINIGTGTQTNVLTKSNILLTDSTNSSSPAGPALPAGPMAPSTPNQCNISPNVIQLSSQLGNITVNSNEISINDSMSDTTSITPSGVNTNMINVKNINVMNNMNFPLYQFPTTLGTAGQVLSVQNGTTQLGWQNINTSASSITAPATFYFGGTMSGTGYTTNITINKMGNICVLSIDPQGLTGLLNDSGATQSVFQCVLSGVNPSFLPATSSLSLCGIQFNQMMPSGMFQTVVDCDLSIETGGAIAQTILIKFLTRNQYNVGWFYFYTNTTFDLSRQYYGNALTDWKYRASITATYQTNN